MLNSLFAKEENIRTVKLTKDSKFEISIMYKNDMIKLISAKLLNENDVPNLLLKCDSINLEDLQGEKISNINVQVLFGDTAKDLELLSYDELCNVIIAKLRGK